jgi:two-component system OmpR family response regulator
MKTIFLVHDQQESPTIRKEYLESAGFTVKLLTSGNQLHSALEKETPAALVLDVLLEGKNGFEVCQDVHLKHRQRTFPILICTHIYRGRQFRDEAVRLGASDYLLLPMGFEDFIERLGDALREFRAEATAA